MKLINTKLKEIKILEPEIFKDERGFFFESFNSEIFKNIIGSDIEFIQDNHSLSKKGVLRGLHYQIPPNAQGKLIRVIAGEVFDVAVDIRKSSKSFGKWVGVFLSSKNKRQIWIPEGFAHAFLTLENNSEVVYKTTAPYDLDSERSIKWNDPDLKISWPTKGLKVSLSKKDSNSQYISQATLFD